MKISKSITLPIQPVQLFDLMQNYSVRLDWDPFLRKAIVLTSDQPGNGEETYCESWFGCGLYTKYVSYRRPGVVAMKLARPSRLFRKFAGSWIYKTTQSGGTHLDFTYAFETNKWLVWISPIVGVFLKFEMGRRLTGLKRYCQLKNPPPVATS